MKVISDKDAETRRGPEEWFTGNVWMAASSVPQPGARIVRVLFEPGARTNWHTHPEGQILHVTTGTGRAQSEGGEVVEIQAGDVVYFAPSEKHWHGAAPDSFMVHLAVNPALSTGGDTDWMEPVTDEEYSA